MRKLPLVLLSGLLVIVSPGVFASDLGCKHIDPRRAKEICHSLSRHRVWEWVRGVHNLQFPGWEVSLETAKDTYCELHITQDDLEALTFLHRIYYPDSRMTSEEYNTYDTLQKYIDSDLSLGAGYLIGIVEGLDGHVEQEGNVFDPRSPYYVLKEGCPKN